MAYTFDFGDDEPTLEAAVYQALGTASVCWDENGVFQEQVAREVGEALIAFIVEYYNKDEV